MRRWISTAKRLAEVFGIRLVEVAVRYGFTLALAFGLGAVGTGQIYLGLSVITLAAAFARCGVDSVAMRRLAVALDRSDGPAARGIVCLAAGWTVLMGLLLTALLYLGTPLLAAHAFGSAAPEAVLRAIACGVLGLAMQMMIGGLLSASGRPVFGQFVSSVLWPLLVMLYLLVPGAEPAGTAFAITVSMLIAASLGGIWCWRLIGRRGPVAWPRLVPILTAARPLFGAELVQILLNNLPIIALGLVANEAEVGRFGLVTRMSMLLTVLTVAMFAANAARFARLHAAGDLIGLEQATHSASRMIAGASLPAVLLLCLLPGPILGLFGADFRAAAPLLVILALGQFGNALTSQSYVLLAMTGHEQRLWHNSALGVLALAVGLLVLLPLFGSLGAAIATAGAYLVIGVANSIGTRSLLGINILRGFRRDQAGLRGIATR